MRTAVRHEAELDQSCINTVRFLSVDAVQKANSGHPGMPLGAAPMAYTLWTRLLKQQSAVHLELKLERLISVVNTLEAGSALDSRAPAFDSPSSRR